MKYLVIFLFISITWCAGAQPQQKKEQLMVDGINRHFIVYIPQMVNDTGKRAVVISLHGRLGTGEQMLRFADFRSIADREKFIIVCPDGINRSWNYGRATPAYKKGINDIKFIGQLLDHILKTYHGDAARVYITGMSNGGFMASRLACQLGNRIAAIAIVGASMDEDMDYHPLKPMPVMYIQGTKDPLVPFAGGPMKGAGGNIYGHEQILKLWADAAHCDAAAVSINLPADVTDGTSVIKEEYRNPATGIKVVGYTITNGGHTWPDGTQYLPKFLIGTVSHNLNACDVIWQFFKGYAVTN